MALIDAQGKVENVILLEDGAEWSPPDGMTVVEAADDAEAGGNYRDGAFERAPRLGPNPAELSLEEQVKALAEKVAALEENRLVTLG
jgi:hypothetical protein